MNLGKRIALVTAAQAAIRFDDNLAHSRFWPWVASGAVFVLCLWLSRPDKTEGADR